MSQSRLYSSVSVKIGAERGRLLAEDSLRGLAQCRSLEEFVSNLGGTAYGEGVAKVESPYSSERLEKAFKENLFDVCFKLVSISPGSISPFLRTCLLRFEHDNIKTILRSVSVGLPHDQILNRVHVSVEEFLGNSEVFMNAVRGINVKGVVDAFESTAYGPVLTSGLRRYEETGAVSVFDILLDRMFHEELSASFADLPTEEQRHASFCVDMRVDGFNLFAILRAKNWGYDPHWIRMATSHHSHNLSREELEALIMADGFESALNLAKKGYYQRFFQDQGSPEEIISNAEWKFAKAMVEHARETRVGDPFNVGAPLGLMTEKEAEVRDLTIIALGIEYGSRSDEIISQLLL